MSIIASMRKRKGLLVASIVSIVALFYLLSPFIQSIYHGTVRRVSGIHFGLGGYPIHKDSKNLPDVVVESERTVCCRMQVCDFRFPLPRQARIAKIDPVSGGFDTIKGAIYLTNADGGVINLGAYAKLIYKDGFHVSDGEFGFTASSADGGFIAAETSGLTTKIDFSFFGDY